MTWWIAPVVLTVLALVLLLLPLRLRNVVATRAVFDRAVYRDQLAELDRDISRGLLAESEVAASRLELQRRLLAVPDDAPPAPPRAHRALPAVLAVMLTGSALAIYLTIGVPGLPDMPFAARVPGAQAETSALADQLEARLRAGAGNRDGWLLLARTAAGLDQWPRAAEAYRQAMLQGAKGPDVTAGYGETLVMLAGGTVTPDALKAFQQAQAEDPKFPIPRYYLGLAELQAGRTPAALAIWRALLAEQPAGSPARDILSQRIAEAARAAGLPP